MPNNFGSNLSGKDADLFEDVLNDESLLLDVARRPCIEFIFGEPVRPGSSLNDKDGIGLAPGMPNFENLSRWGGRGKRLRLGQSDGTWTDVPDTFAAQSAGVVPVQPAVRGEAKFLYDHIHIDQWIQLRDWWDAQENPRKMDSLVAETRRQVEGSLATKLSLTGFHGVGTPDQDSIGSWRDLIATTGLYGGIDRALADNANFVARQYTSFTIATWTYKKAISIIARSAEQGGSPTLLPLTRTMYENALDAIFQEFVPTTNDDMVWLRGKWPRVQGMHFVLDADTGGAGADENTTCALDTRKFRVLMKKMNGASGKQRDMVVSGSFERNPNYVGMMQMQMDMQVQIIYIDPRTAVGIYN
jgi:hypothetical protein